MAKLELNQYNNKSMGRKTFIIILLIIGIGIAVTEGVPQRALEWARQFKFTEKLLATITDQQLLPGPLQGPLEAIQSNLTREGIVAETNKQREANGLTALHVNVKLQKAAEAKLDDMFSQQYFDHVSPKGVSPAEVITQADYRFVVVGENLALGNFKDDATLVQAWMDSPGHRANILHKRFLEIGVAARKGTFNGKEVWLAVQEFGTPLAVCPGPESNLKDKVDTNRNQITSWQSELAQLKSDIDGQRYQSRAEYNTAVERYNSLVGQLNLLIEATRILVDQYNSEVNSFNQCLENNG